MDEIFEGDRMPIFESDFDYSEWDEKDYSPSELNVNVSTIQLRGGILNTGKPIFGFRIIYELHYNSKAIFSFEGTKMFSFPLEYASIHFLSFLTEITIKKFHEEFLKKNQESGVYRQKFFPRTLDEIFDDLVEALALIHSQAKTT